MLTKEDLLLIRSVRDRMLVTKVVATRAIKTKQGDFFVGFSAAWDSKQEDAGGGGADLIDALPENVPPQGMTLKEAKIAGYLLSLQVDLQAQDSALAGGAMSVDTHRRNQQMTRQNYDRLLEMELGKGRKTE